MTTNPSWQPSVGRQGRTFAFLEGAKLGKSAECPDLAGKDTKFVPGPPGAWGRAPRTLTAELSRRYPFRVKPPKRIQNFNDLNLDGEDAQRR